MKTRPRKKGLGRPAHARRLNESPKHRKMLEVLRHFRIVIKSVRRHYQLVESRSSVSGAQLWALAHIAENPGTKVGDLARALAIHQSTASNLVRRLELLALVTRKRIASDQRTVQLSPTGKGSKALKRAPRPLIGVLQQALSELPASSLDALHRHLGELIGAMKIKDVRARDVPLSEM